MTIPTDVQERVNALVGTGRYVSEEEVLRAAVMALEERNARGQVGDVGEAMQIPGVQRHPERASFVLRANELARAGERSRAMDMLYDKIDELMRSGQLERLDDLLKGVREEELSADVLLGLLTATLPARNRLPSRAKVLRETERILRARCEFQEGLLAGLV
jgi:Arc/MetJ-type ribon-helix-helix transcriptional regulator